MSGETQTSSIRDSLNAAVEKIEKEESSAPTTEAGADNGPAAPVESSNAVAAAASADAPVAGDSGNGERARGPDGKFLPKGKATEAATKAPAQAVTTKTANTDMAPPAEPSATPAPVAPVQTPTVKAPQSWKADVREKFNALPPEVQQEVLRREAEIAKTVQDVSEPKKFHEQFQKEMAPFAHVFQSRGIPPLKAAVDLMPTAVVLHTGSADEKARAIAQAIQAFGVDIPTLAALIDGAPQTQQTQQPQHVDPAAIAQQVEQRILSQMQERQAQKAAQNITAWAEGKEFLDDVKDDVADMIELASRRGRELTLDEAYEKACRNHPDVSKVLQQRDAAKSAQAAQAEAQRARNASASVKTTSTASVPTAPKSRREALEEAAAKVGR